MFDEEFFPRWFRRRFPFYEFFRDAEEMFREMEREFDRLFKDKELLRERVLPDGTRIQEFGPIIYGYSMTIGPDGKPVIREFGNIKKEMGPGIRPRLGIREEREPLVDVITTENEVKVFAELPGIEKEDIKLQGTPTTLTISADNPQRKYYKEVELPVEVDIEKAKSTYKNGVLEVVLPKKEVKEKGKTIKVE
ncbi:MAG: archaeal heat shock protein Hsp20 [Candidatus Methanomethylicaceae archaeon]|nr:Hsp20/alpha crystallin family protein [Candidatus Verstraetearchaeota archaeon]